jgi:guanylate kinase
MVESITTRDRRPTDLPGEYRYIDRRTAEQITRDEKLLWTNEHAGHLYVTAARTVEEALRRTTGQEIMILVPGVMQRLKEFVIAIDGSSQNLVLFFIKAPALETLRERVRQRGQDPTVFEERWRREADWEGEAKRSSIGYTFIDNPEGHPEKAIEQILEHLQDELYS